MPAGFVSEDKRVRGERTYLAFCHVLSRTCLVVELVRRRLYLKIQMKRVMGARLVLKLQEWAAHRRSPHLRRHRLRKYLLRAHH